MMQVVIEHQHTSAEVLRWSAVLLTAASSFSCSGLRERLIPTRRVAAIIVALALAVISLTTSAIAAGTDHVQTEQDLGRTHEQPQG